jgi:plastocyanin
MRVPPVRWSISIAATVGLLLLTDSCGFGSSNSGLPKTASVTIPHADRFDPFIVKVATGATVTFKNEDTDGHTVVAMPTDPEDFKLLVPAGKQASYTFNQAGVYGYYCDAHSDYDASTGLIKAKKGVDAYPISMYGFILVVDDKLPISSGRTKVVVPEADRFAPLAIVVRKGT